MAQAAPVPAEGAAVEDRIAVASNWKLVWWRFRRHRLAVVSAVLLILMYCVVIAPDFFSTQNPEQTDARQAFIPAQGIRLFHEGRLDPWVPAVTG
jgi:peptide/nickel transport system permease protein